MHCSLLQTHIYTQAARVPPGGPSPLVDMLRVRKCERVLLSEEALWGQFTKDPNTGSLIPVCTLPARALAASLKQDSMRRSVHRCYCCSLHVHSMHVYAGGQSCFCLEVVSVFGCDI